MVDAGDPNPVELGVKFTPDYNGSITGVRFYKSSGEHRHAHRQPVDGRAGRAWPRRRSPARAASGWQSVTFSSPVPVTAGTTYVASYFAPNGHYSVTQFGFSASVYNQPLHALGEATSPNGVYAYGATSPFPNASYRSSNYWVDVLYAVPAPGQVSGVTRERERADLGDRLVVAAGERRPGHVLPDHAVRRLDRAGAHGRDGNAAGDEPEDHGPDDRDDLPVHGAGA